MAVHLQNAQIAKKKNAFEAKGHQYTKDKVIQRSFNIDLYTCLAMYRYR